MIYKDVFETYGNKLYSLGQQNKKIVVVDCDLGQACGTTKFKENIPERYVNVGIAEQNGIGVAAGLAANHLIPIVHTFAVFASLRAIEQIRNSVCYPNMNVKIIGARAGVTNALLGATHHAIEDMGVLSAIPNMVVLAPYDYCEIEECLEEAVNYVGPVYIRLDRIQCARVNKEKAKIGKAQLLKDGSDITIIGVGDQVINCINAGEELEKQGYSVRVINLSSVKPLDNELIMESAAKTKKIITVESHNVRNGVGSEICRVVSAQCPVPIKTLGINDVFTETGNYDLLLEKYSISKNAVISEALNLLKK
ncbi:MAG TPA: transketolase C-terminal domain-containing protein [Ruminiclostridium sp.]|nr:transketolase C-terminal domain-containing protein [Ruminiclostridium sp.]